jgi:hypothetical protein
MEVLEIGIGAFIASLVAGIGIGVYFAKLHYFRPPRCNWKSQLVTMTTLGWSFLIPLAIEQRLFEAGRAMGTEEWTVVLLLWLLFSAASVATNTALSKKTDIISGD